MPASNQQKRKQHPEPRTQQKQKQKQKQNTSLGVALGLLAFEVVLNTAIVLRVSYTEIDWRAYMQQVACVAELGERNYLKLAGDTGPLVYPAGFVWIYRGLWAITDGGTDIRLAQLVFMAVYLATMAAVLAIYSRAQTTLARVHPAGLVLLVLSKRLHSIYVLRLFNDTMAMLFAYLAILAMTVAATERQRTTRRRWPWAWYDISTLLLSAGISVKMNVQLMLPGAAYIWLRAGGAGFVLRQMALVVVSQIVVGAPFLLRFPREYLARAFDFTRQFDFTWTVNWRFVGKQVFESTEWARALLAIHLVLLAVLGLLVWPQRFSRTSARSVVEAGVARTRIWQRFGSRRLSQGLQRMPPVTADEIIAVMFTSNFVGVVCARSLHYQFYAWYAHMLPLLLHLSHVPPLARPLLWLMIEYAWNVYPRKKKRT
ncbi:dolichyl-P-Man:Man(5)GlcNAc(2)-PP-dolichol alpha-1,3-mannosyltransferase [Coemansia sp. RSA 1804]|nr:dolichyl-P-Man:Man(5)GlcNAc(2)-PP-dolichol alpha-1,3-mannosyltransferase [Coemansia sp. RSA 1804]